jgi:pimeloyl-ACP methyl ester carboxylesterase
MPSLHVREHGAGPPLVLIHGFCETGSIWDSFIEPLTTRFRILRPDLPGFGNTALWTHPITLEEVADALADWLIRSGTPPVMMLGHSLGGYVTLAVAERHPEVLKGFGLFHSTAYADTDEKKANRNRIVDFVQRHGVPPFAETFVPGLFYDKQHPAIPGVQTLAAGTRPETLIQYACAMRDRPDRCHVLVQSALPTLIIAGKEDGAVPVSDSRQMAKLSRKTTYFELEHVAHMGFLEAPTECRAIATSFTDPLFQAD